VHKIDNGLVSPELEALFGKYGVIMLVSPPEYPSYNGTCEAGNNSLGDWTDHQTALAGRPGCWTSVDLAAARELANWNARPWGHQGPVPAEVFESRIPVTEEDRQRFKLEVDKWERLLSKAVPVGRADSRRRTGRTSAAARSRRH